MVCQLVIHTMEKNNQVKADGSGRHVAVRMEPGWGTPCWSATWWPEAPRLFVSGVASLTGSRSADAVQWDRSLAGVGKRQHGKHQEGEASCHNKAMPRSVGPESGYVSLWLLLWDEQQLKGFKLRNAVIWYFRKIVVGSALRGACGDGSDQEAAVEIHPERMVVVRTRGKAVV